MTSPIRTALITSCCLAALVSVASAQPDAGRALARGRHAQARD